MLYLVHRDCFLFLKHFPTYYVLNQYHQYQPFSSIHIHFINFNLNITYSGMFIISLKNLKFKILKIKLFFLVYKPILTQLHLSVNGITVPLIFIVPLFFSLYLSGNAAGYSSDSILTASCIPKCVILVLIHINLVSVLLFKMF